VEINTQGIAEAAACAVPSERPVQAALLRDITGILAYYDCRISTGPLEGTNNKIRTMQRQAYGFRDKEFFKLKIYVLHEAKYALVG
jgi:transposase